MTEVLFREGTISILLYFVFVGACRQPIRPDPAEDADLEHDAPVIPENPCEFTEDPISRPDPEPSPDEVDYLIITADQLEYQAGDHARFRQQNRHHSEVLLMSQVIETETGELEPDRDVAIEMIRAAIAERRERLDPERVLFVLLLGDAMSEWSASTFSIPAPSVARGWEWERIVLSDNAIADLDGDDIPDVALGRIPVSTAQDADRVLSRTRDFETNYVPGHWNYKINVFASAAGFGEVIDGVIEDVGFEVVNEAPADWVFSFTYASQSSAYTYPPAEFSDYVYSLINDGSVLTSYIGHGGSSGFGSISWDSALPEDSAPILDTSCLDALDIRNRSPLLLFITCNAGAFQDQRCLSEELMLHQGGPAAIISSTSFSHPYPCGVMSRELMHAMLIQRLATVGEIFLESKRRMLSEVDDPMRQWMDSMAVIDPSSGTPELREELLISHEHIYVLLGDPAHRVAAPAGTVDIELLSDEVEAGQPVEACVHVHGPPSGRAVVTLETDRATMAYNTERWEMGQHDRDEIIRNNHNLANNKVLQEWQGSYQGGGLFVSLPTSAEHPGSLFLRVYAYDEELDAMGLQTVEVIVPDLE